MKPGPAQPAPSEADRFISGFVTILGRPNVGKSTLVNALVGTKVAIVSDKPQTTRTAIRGVRTTPSSQIVLLDTPGVHKPRTLLGERTNQRAVESLASVDVVCVVVAANQPIGPGDRFVADLAGRADPPARIAVVSKTDIATREAVADQLAELAAGELGEFDAYVPVSARRGIGLDALIAEIESRLPEGPAYYPPGEVSDQPESFLAAELVREQLLAGAREELPHSITVSVDEIEERTTNAGEPLLALRCIVRVERDSQKGIIIGKGGERLKRAGRAARLELETLLGTRVHLETHVKVDPDWQHRAASLDRLGY
jgi:GTP-binding protein Era